PPFALFVSEIAGLADRRHAARGGIEADVDGAAGGRAGGAVPAPLFGRGFRRGTDAGGVEALQPILHAVGDDEIVAIERAVAVVATCAAFVRRLVFVATPCSLKAMASSSAA